MKLIIRLINNKLNNYTLTKTRKKLYKIVLIKGQCFQSWPWVKKLFFIKIVWNYQTLYWNYKLEHCFRATFTFGNLTLCIFIFPCVCNTYVHALHYSVKNSGAWNSVMLYNRLCISSDQETGRLSRSPVWGLFWTMQQGFNTFYIKIYQTKYRNNPLTKDWKPQLSLSHRLY